MACTREDGAEATEVDFGELIVDKDCKIEEGDLGDGQFGYMFEIYDIQGNSVTTDMAFITVEGDKITTMLTDDEDEEE